MSSFEPSKTRSPDSQAADELARRIADAMPADQQAFRRRLRAIKRAIRDRKPCDRNLARLNSDLERSSTRRKTRAANAPVVRFEHDLPILAKRDEIAAAIREHRVIVVCGETGSGKSTQLPKICLAAERGIAGMIGHTQPRRIAARSVAARLAEELATPLGEAVGYKVRFQDQTRPDSYVKLMTDGILVAETQSDRQLRQYDTIIIDEAHERSLNIDFLLGYLNRLVESRPELRVIITSATIDAARFAEYFGSHAGPAPVIEVSGRGYPVEIRYLPGDDDQDDDQDDDHDVARRVADAVGDVIAEGDGDILVFLPTERDIRDTAKVLRGRVAKSVDVLPLYARLSAAEQGRVFQVHSKRRIVLATNVAESSLTVPGIRYVIDTGTARVSRFSPRCKVQRLPIEAVSQASANQRAGRCGRVGPGICLRLYSEPDFLSRDAYTTPEIRRMNLAAVILRMLALKQGAVEDFPFLDRPRPDAVRAGYKTLFELGAIDEQRQLTNVGRQLSELPVDPRIGRMILAARDENCLSDVLILAAALEIQDPRERPVEKQEAADRAHSKWCDERSDFLSLLKLWDFYHELKADLSRSRLRKACQKNFLSSARMREWQDMHRQLRDLVQQRGYSIPERRNAYAPIHRSLLAGLLSSVATRRNEFEYLGGDEQSFYLWPGAGPFERKPKWVIAAELVETSRRFLRCVASIDPSWIEPLAGHLVKRTYSTPFWSRKQETVLAAERTLLFGLTVGRRRGVRFGPVDPVAARQVFLREALVQDQVRTRLGFLGHNTQLLHQISAEAARTRDRRLVLDEASLREFYDARLPAEVFDVTTLRLALKADKDLESRLVMTRSDLIDECNSSDESARFPDTLQIDHHELAIAYRFAQGEADDGLTVTVPADLIHSVDDDQLGWLVPGLLEEKIVALIRALPKPIRRQLVPAPDTAARIVERVEFGTGPFLATIAGELAREAGTAIPAELLTADQLPDYLRLNLRVVDEEGSCVAEGRDLAEIRRQLGGPSETPAGEIRDPAWHRDGIREWDFGPLPSRVDVARGTFRLVGFPAVLDQGEDVAIRLLHSPDEARAATIGGVRRLFLLGHGRAVREQIEWWPEFARIKKLAATLPSAAPFDDQLANIIAHRALAGLGDVPRDAEAFSALCDQAVPRIPVAVQESAGVVNGVFERYGEVRQQLSKWRSVLPDESAQDIDHQLEKLLAADFLVRTPWPWLKHVPRFLEAITLRIEKIRSGNAARDLRSLNELQPFLEQLSERGDSPRGTARAAVEEFRWLVEECRVSLFAQELGTSIKVSPQRLQRFWEKNCDP